MAETTIAHISDLHINPQFKKANILRTRILLQKVNELEPDHVVVTGDVTSGALPEDFAEARELFLEAGLLHPSRLTLVIGNHDIYGGLHTAEDILTFPGRCRTTSYDLKVREFAQSFPEAFKWTLTASKDTPFPFVKMINDVALIGLNSVAGYSGVRNPLGSNGWVGDQQVDQFDLLVGSPLLAGKRKVVLIHHHFCKLERTSPGTMQTVWGTIERQTMKLRGKKDLLKLFRRHGVELVLHGHYHRSAEYTKKGITFLNAGGAVLDELDRGLHINLVHLGSEGVTTSVKRAHEAVGLELLRSALPMTAELEQAA